MSLRYAHRTEGVLRRLPDDARQKSQNPRNRHPSLKAREIKRMRVKIKRWDPSRIMSFPDPRIQTQKRKWSQAENLAGGVREPLPRYALWIPVWVSIHGLP